MTELGGQKSEISKSLALSAMRFALSCMGALLIVLSLPAQAQQQGKIRRIGMLISGSASTHKSQVEAFQGSLRELGYVEGKHVVFEYRYAEGRRERSPNLAAEIVRWGPDIIVVTGVPFTASAKKASNTIPIVVMGAGDLVGTGLVSSLARPGGNVTGTTSIAPDLSGKRIELIKEIMPQASRLAVLAPINSGSPSPNEESIKQSEIAAPALGVKLQVIPIRTPDDFQVAFAAMKKGNADALFIIHSTFTFFHGKQLTQVAAKNRLPTVCENFGWAEWGCLITYAPDSLHHPRRAAVYVDKILKGAKAADLPVEQPTKFELVVNLKTAKQIGVTIPQKLLARADKVIK
jgi:putative ABC transport system substrate-binding protein